MRKLVPLTPPGAARTIHPPTILDPAESGDVEALAHILAAIAVRLATKGQPDAMCDLPARIDPAAGSDRRVA